MFQAIGESSASKTMCATTAIRSCPSFNEVRSVDNLSGSIGKIAAGV
jgi:hypothetical protein